MSQPHILVVDDDAALRKLLLQYLRQQGDYRLSEAENGSAMTEVLANETIDLIILDIMMPGEDGLSIARRLHEQQGPPVIILSAKGDETDRIVGLEIGADDYMAKPFAPRELLARIRSVLRRRTPPIVTADADRFVFGAFKYNKASTTLQRDNQTVSLTSGESALLGIFLENPNKTLSRDTLLTVLKGYDSTPFDRSIDVRVTRLRKKIEDDPASPVYIRTVRGMGYMFTPQGQLV